MAEADVADEGRVLGYRGEAKEGGKEIVREAVCVGGERAIPIFPRGVGMVKGKVI